MAKPASTLPPPPDKSSDLLAWITLGIYALLQLAYIFTAKGVWDDDCITRFHSTQMAHTNPEVFVGTWYRPLFVWLFYLPSQLGYVAVQIGMAALSAAGAWLLYKGLQKSATPLAVLAIPFYLFQPYLFGTSHHALTEPIAAFLLCAGFYFSVTKNWKWFALTGGLLPLARLELAPLLLIWALVLLKEKQTKQLPWLAVGGLLWGVVALVITGDFLYPLHQTFGQNEDLNRYGHRPFYHYFVQFIHVTGPVVFLFVLPGLVERLKKSFTDFFVAWQFVAGFGLYVAISTVFVLGQPAGFLRNLVPLSPLVALLALSGVNAAAEWGKSVLKKNTNKNSFLLPLLLAGGFWVAMMTSKDLKSPILDYELYLPWQYAILALAAFALLFFTLPLANQWKGTVSTAVSFTASALPALVALLMIVPTDVNENEERQTVRYTAQIYINSNLRNYPLLVNHPWFYWVTHTNPSGSIYRTYDANDLMAAPPGTVVIWEDHITSRLKNVPGEFFNQAKNWVLLTHFNVPKTEFNLMVLQKLPQGATLFDVTDAFIDSRPDVPESYIDRARYLLNVAKDTTAAERDAAMARRLAPNLGEAVLLQGEIAFARRDYKQAFSFVKQALEMNPKQPSGWMMLGQLYELQGEPQNAIGAYNTVIRMYPQLAAPYAERGKILARSGLTEDALKDFKTCYELNPAMWQPFAYRAELMFNLANYPQALRDYESVIKRMPLNTTAWLGKARTHDKLSQPAEACTAITKAIELKIENGDSLKLLFCE